jgi:hypothetical protein
MELRLVVITGSWTTRSPTSTSTLLRLGRRQITAAAPRPAPAPVFFEPDRQLWHSFGCADVQRMQRPRQELVSALVGAQIDGEHLALPELLGFRVLLLVAGNETTTNVIPKAVLCFDESPSTLDELRQDPQLLPTAVEEALRLRSTVQSAAWPIDPGVDRLGQSRRAGLHRSRPIRPHRNPSEHLAFSHGIHSFLGAPLARLESRIALGFLVRRFPGLPRVPKARLEPQDSFIVYGVKSLPLARARGSRVTVPNASDGDSALMRAVWRGALAAARRPPLGEARRQQRRRPWLFGTGAG